VSKLLFEAVAFERAGGLLTATFRLTFDRSLDEVWAALTVPDRFVDWLAPGGIELRPGGTVKLNFPDSGIVIDSVISQLEPPRLMEYSWSAPGEPLRPLRFDLKPAGAAVELTVALGVPETEDVARTAAGWAAHLEMLTSALAGAPIKFPFEVFKVARETYRAQLSGTPLS